MFNNPKQNRLSEQEKEYDKTKKMFQSFGPGTITLLVITGFVFVILVTYSLAFAKGFTVIGNELGIDTNNPNFGGMAYGLGNNETPVAECVLYTDEVLISEDDCESHVDCAPNGICLLSAGKCAYFLN